MSWNNKAFCCCSTLRAFRRHFRNSILKAQAKQVSSACTHHPESSSIHFHLQLPTRLQLKGSQGQFWLSYIIHLLPPCHACSKPCFSSLRGWPRAPGWPSSLLPEDQRAALSARDKKNPGEDILPCFPACWSGGQGKTCSYFSTLPFTLTTTIWRVFRFNVFSADSDEFLKLSTTLYYLLMTPDSEVFLHVLPHFPVFELPSHVRAKQL